MATRSAFKFRLRKNTSDVSVSRCSDEVPDHNFDDSDDDCGDEPECLIIHEHLHGITRNNFDLIGSNLSNPQTSTMLGLVGFTYFLLLDSHTTYFCGARKS